MKFASRRDEIKGAATTANGYAPEVAAIAAFKLLAEARKRSAWCLQLAAVETTSRIYLDYQVRAPTQGVWAFETLNLSASRALILNSSYQPVKLVCWQKALVLWFQGKVEVLEYHHTASARSAQASFKLPSVMRLKRYVTPRRSSRLKFSRENIYLRDNYTCQYCARRFSAKDLTLDHVVPASKFGRKDWTNVVAACRPCNHRKANRTPLGAGMPLLNEPRIPSWLPVVQPEFKIDDMPDEWRLYLGVG